jgi:hypothetical protein
LHKRLARVGGLDDAGPPEPLDTGPREPGLPGYHGVQRPRKWDALAMAEAPGLSVDETEFTTLADGTLLLDDGLDPAVLEPLMSAIEARLQPPYRAEAVRRTGDVWAVAARSLDVVELPGMTGDEISLTVQDGARTLVVDGRDEFGGVPVLERLAGERYESYVVLAERIDADLWEVRVTPL